MAKVAFIVAVSLLAVSATATRYCARITGQQLAVPVEESAAFVNCDAFGEYNRTANTTGWNVLKVTTNGSVTDEAQAYALGFLEGYVSAEDIYNFHQNTLGQQGSFGPVNDQTRAWIRANDEWMLTQAVSLAALDPRWAYLSLQLTQIEGILAGVNAAGFNYTREQLLISMSMPDVVSDLVSVFPNARSQSIPFLQRALHCSSIVKVTDDFSNLLFGHTTWMNFNTMLRVFKTITINYNTVPIAGKTMQFSSYPGSIASTDDFYALSSGLGVMETSFSIFNTSLYSVLTPQSLLSSYRSVLANRLANSGREWAEVFGFHNSGTYNNQWMVVDMKRFTPGQSLQPGTLWVVEQLPGIIDAHDQTEVLSYGYWPSFNVPVNKTLYDLAGYGAHAQSDPEFNSYQNSVRAQLFRELQSSVRNTSDLKNLLQYNQYQTNPIEKGYPLYAIAARGDLLPGGAAQGFGGIDCKVTSYQDYMMNNAGTVFGFSGPTPQQEVFSFATSNATGLNPHAGLPTTFDFKWQVFNP